MRTSPGMLATAAMLVTAIAAGCSSAKRVSQENDRLRARVLELEDANHELTGRIAELDAQIRQPETDLAVSREVLDATPHVAELSIGALSHAADTDGDGQVDTLTVYVTPADGRGRFVQVVGDLSVNAAVIPADGDAVTIGRTRLGPATLRDAYRATLLGTHYTVEVPITVAEPDTQTECTVKVEFVDGYDGRRITAQRVIGLQEVATKRPSDEATEGERTQS